MEPEESDESDRTVTEEAGDLDIDLDQDSELSDDVDLGVTVIGSRPAIVEADTEVDQNGEMDQDADVDSDVGRLRRTCHRYRD